MPSTAAQDEFDALIYGNGKHSPSHPHPADHHSRSNSSSSHNGENSSRDLEKRAVRAGNRSCRDSDYENEASELEAASSGLGPRKSGKMRYYVPKTRSEANTGPKGVIADAQAFELARRAHRSVTSLAQQQHQAPVQYTSAGLHDKSNRLAGQTSQHHARSGSWLMEADEDEESDDDFMTRWRQSRLQELNKQRGVNGYIGRRSRSAPRYGSLVGVDAEGYLDAVEQTKSDTIVCVFIYDDASEVSRLIEHAAAAVARANPTVRFVKLHYEEAQMDPMGVPAMLAYRGGDKFADMVPIIDEIPLEDELSAETLSIAMIRCGLLP